MKILSKSFNDIFLPLQDYDEFLQNLRIAGNIAAKAISLLKDMIANKTDKSLIELDLIIEQFIRDNSAIPTFKGYRNFPNSCCFSINKQLVHGLATNYKLQEGDVIKLDLGVTYNHTIGDVATTVIFGQPKCKEHVRLLEATRKALIAGVKSIKINNRIGCIGNAIYKCATAENFRVITNYGGHTIIRDNNGNEILHGHPFISNRDSPNNGIRIQPGMVVCIEPMLTTGDIKTNTKNDNWTVTTENINAHEEVTVYVHQDRVEIITS
jgi:methionyl aminopeptidase